MTKVSLTGASGFIGRYLLPKLIESGFDVKALDLDGGLYPKGITVVRGDLFTRKGLGKFLDGADTLIHLAGQVLPGKTSMEEGNVQTTQNLIKECYKFPIKKVIFASTIAVYGDSNAKIFKETDICKPNTQYGESKLKAEKIIETWSKNSSNPHTIFRFFSIYGPENTKGVVYNLCKDFIETGVVTIYGTGKQSRDFMYVEDVAEILSLAVSKKSNGIYNVGTGKYYSILDLVSILESVSGKKCRILFKDAQIQKVDEVTYSIQKLERIFNWSPSVGIEEGFKKVYQHIKNEK